MATRGTDDNRSYPAGVAHWQPIHPPEPLNRQQSLRDPQIAVIAGQLHDRCARHAGVGYGLLSAWHAPREGAPISKTRSLAGAPSTPTDFSGPAADDLYRPMDAVCELRRCVTELGFKGLRVVPWPSEAATPSATGWPIPYIGQVALDFPEIDSRRPHRLPTR